jgi:hypothetical protein
VNDKSFSIEEQMLSNLQKFLIYSFFELHIDQCESFDVGAELTREIDEVAKKSRQQQLKVTRQ